MNKPILLDGSAGSLLWEMAEKAGVPRAPVWKYNIEQPELVLELHRRYIDAGSRMLQTNTFDANRLSVRRSSDYSVEQVVKSAVALAKQATQGLDIKVYLSAGPLGTLLEPYGKLSKAEAEDIYTEMLGAGAAAGVDAVALETFMDVEMMYIAAKVAKSYGIPVFCSMTFGKRRRTMMGDSVQKIVDKLLPLGIDAIGMNCSAGPVEALPVIQEYKERCSLPLYFKPNSGMGEAYSALQFAEEVRPALDYVSYVGGCCGCDDSYIKELKKLL